MQTTSTSGQLALPFQRTESSLRQFLEERLNKAVVLILTDNSTTMLSVRPEESVLHLRLHRIFLSAGNEIIDEIVLYLKDRTRKMPGFRSFVREHREQLRARRPNKVGVKTKGRFFDLGELFWELNDEYFERQVTAAITWGTGSARYAVRKRTLGSYSERSHTIRINPVLDKKSVPRYYIASVVHHEMLHAAMGISQNGKRRSIHSREFRTRERMFRDYEKARAWERGGG